MNQTQKLPSGGSLDQAFTALENYDRGSGRAALLPIDEAVYAAGNDTKLRRTLQERLLNALLKSLSTPAREYVLAKLALVGDTECPTRLPSYLLQPPVDTAMRTALQIIPGPKTSKALLALLTSSSDDQKVGVIASLGIRCDPDAVRVLASLLHDLDPKVVIAALGAIGQTGTQPAGKALKAFVPSCVETRKAHSDALLTCGGHLLAHGNKSDAKELYALLNTDGYASFVRTAAVRGLKACT